jgi:outer membrane lipoprotein-sorting protein
MKFLRTVSTRWLLASIAGLLVAIGAGTAIAVAAAGPGPVPKAESLAQAVHGALSARKVTGISADVSFTNGLIGSTDFTGGSTDPILQGATGRLWLSKGQMRLELQSTNGDAQVVVNQHSFWVSDPSTNTVYEGTLPAEKPGAKSSAVDQPRIPNVAHIQADLNKLMKHVDLSGATPSDVAGQAAYTVRISPKHDGGLLGSAQIAWDAVRGVPLRVAIYARGNTTPVLALEATNISYGSVPASDFAITPPLGAKVVKISSASGSASTSARKARRAMHSRHPELSGTSAVSASLPFKLVAPAKLVGLPRHTVKGLDWAGKPAALVTYGQNLGGIVVIEHSAGATSAASSSQTSSSNQDSGSDLSLPTVSINGATGQELDTALGTVVSFTRGGVAFTVLGSVPAVAADAAARAL